MLVSMRFRFHIHRLKLVMVSKTLVFSCCGPSYEVCVLSKSLFIIGYNTCWLEMVVDAYCVAIHWIVSAWFCIRVGGYIIRPSEDLDSAFLKIHVSFSIAIWFQPCVWVSWIVWLSKQWWWIHPNQFFFFFCGFCFGLVWLAIFYYVASILNTHTLINNVQPKYVNLSPLLF